MVTPGQRLHKLKVQYADAIKRGDYAAAEKFARARGELSSDLLAVQYGRRQVQLKEQQAAQLKQSMQESLTARQQAEQARRQEAQPVQVMPTRSVISAAKPGVRPIPFERQIVSDPELIVAEKAMGVAEVKRRKGKKVEAAFFAAGAGALSIATAPLHPIRTAKGIYGVVRHPVKTVESLQIAFAEAPVTTTAFLGGATATGYAGGAAAGRLMGAVKTKVAPPKMVSISRGAVAQVRTGKTITEVAKAKVTYETPRLLRPALRQTLTIRTGARAITGKGTTFDVGAATFRVAGRKQVATFAGVTKISKKGFARLGATTFRKETFKVGVLGAKTPTGAIKTIGFTRLKGVPSDIAFGVTRETPKLVEGIRTYKFTGAGAGIAVKPKGLVKILGKKGQLGMGRPTLTPPTPSITGVGARPPIKADVFLPAVKSALKIGETARVTRFVTPFAIGGLTTVGISQLKVTPIKAFKIDLIKPQITKPITIQKPIQITTPKVIQIPKLAVAEVTKQSTRLITKPKAITVSPPYIPSVPYVPPVFPTTPYRIKPPKRYKPRKSPVTFGKYRPSLLGIERYKKFGITIKKAPKITPGVGIRAVVKAPRRTRSLKDVFKI